MLSAAGGRRWPPVYAIDLSVWPRCDAEASPERGYYYHPSRHSAGQPIVAGWAYQWLAQLSFTRDSWTAPLDVRRVHPSENANAVAVEQITDLRQPPPSDECTAAVRLRRWLRLRPIDAGTGADSPLPSSSACAPTAASTPTRRRRCPRPRAAGRASTGPSSPARIRRPGLRRRAEHAPQDEQYGTVRVRAWAGLHPKQQAHPGRGTRKTRPIVRGTVVLVEVSRLPARPYQPQVLWLWWAGPGEPDLDLLWRAYVRRFDLEHTLRFCKQSLGWTTPRVRHPEQADRWTWLVVAAYTQLRLARPWVADRRLPWERPLDPGKLTPVSRPSCPFCAAADGRHAGQRAKTVRPLAGPPQGPPLRARHPLPGPEKGRLRPAFCANPTPYAAVNRARCASGCG